MPRRSRRVTLGAAAALLIIGIAGMSLASFVATVSHVTPRVSQKADGIVVLTGGDRRLAAGMQLLEGGMAKRLLISGVNPETSREMLRRAHHLQQKRLFACCTDLGYEASDTVGNATEARDWVEHRGYRSLIVVTANYHMPRSLAELAHAMPDVTLIAYPVDPRPDGARPWWFDGQMLRAVGREYVKYLRCAARVQFAHLMQRFAGRPDVARSVAPPPPTDGLAKTSLGPI